ncbi:MAG: class I SAM-dependent methyltransferase [Endomicrobiales bacterium]
MLDTIYYRFVRKLITKKEEQDQYSGGLWPRLVRESSAAVLKDVTGTVMELGCGEGLFLEKLAAANPRASVVGVDARETILDAARRRLARFPNITLVNADALSSDLESGSVDRLFCLNTVQNLKTAGDVKKLFSEAQRLLRPTGSFIFDIRNALCPVIALQYRLVRYYDPGITVPLKAYRTGVIEKAVSESGLRVTGKKPLGFPLRAVAPAVLFTVIK